MKCLNKSLPLVQEVLRVIPSEPMVAKLLDELGDGVTADVVINAYNNKLNDYYYPKNILYGFDNENLEFHTKTINAVSNFLDAIGVEQRFVPEFLDKNGSVIEGAVAAANFLNGSVDIAEKKRLSIVESSDMSDQEKAEKLASFWRDVESKFPEEAAHWWYRLLNKNSPLKEALLQSALTTRKEAELRKTLYGELYKGPRVLGKMDLETGDYKLTPEREEAIGQLIAEAIKRVEDKNATKEDYSFLKQLLEWINNLLRQFKSVKEDPFEVAAMKILSSDLSDLMTFKEWKKMNDAVYFDTVLDEQSSLPLDYTLLTDYLTLSTEQAISTIPDEGLIFRTTLSFKEGKYKGQSLSFNTREEADAWVLANYGRELARMQEKKLQEVKDFEAFRKNLFEKHITKRSKFLKKTLRDLYSVDIVGGGPLNTKFEIFTSGILSTVKKKAFTSEELEDVKNTIEYNTVTPTLRVLPAVLQKYKGKTIPLGEVLKVDGMKKQESKIIESVKNLIKEENPEKKSITPEELVDEVHNFLQLNYLIGFANERKHRDYYMSYLFNKTRGDVPEDLTEESFNGLPEEERRSKIAMLKLTRKESNVLHNKISLRFNNEYFLKAPHFPYGPSSFASLTYFYSGDSVLKNAALLHEIQNDNIEDLNKSQDVVANFNLEEDYNTYLNKLKADLDERILNAKELVATKKKSLHEFTIENYFLYRKKVRPSSYLYRLLDSFPKAGATPLAIESSFNALKSRVKEQIGLYESTPEYSIKNAQQKLDLAYTNRRRWRNFLWRHGYDFRDILSKEDKEKIKNKIDEINAQDDNIEGMGTVSTIQQKVEAFRLYFNGEFLSKINNAIKKMYGSDMEDIAPFSVTIKAKPLPKNKRANVSITRRGRTLRVGNSENQLNNSVDFFLAGLIKNQESQLGKKIEDSKKSLFSALGLYASNQSNKKLLKISLEDYRKLYKTHEANLNLLTKAVEEEAQKEFNKTDDSDKIIALNILSTLESVNDPERQERILIGNKWFKLSWNNEIYSYEDVKGGVGSVGSKMSYQVFMDYVRENDPSLLQLDFAALKEKSLLKAFDKIVEDSNKERERIAKAKVGPEAIKEMIELEKSAFVPLVTHVINKHILQAGKNVPLYFSGFAVGKLAQQNSFSAALYTGKEEITIVNRSNFEHNGVNYRFEGDGYEIPLAFSVGDTKYMSVANNYKKQTKGQGVVDSSQKEYQDARNSYEKAYNLTLKNKADEIKRQAAVELGLAEETDSTEEAINKLNAYRKQDTYKAYSAWQAIELISHGSPIEVGSVYAAMSNIPGIKLIWQPKVEGFAEDAGAYLVDLTNYTGVPEGGQENTPILYGMVPSREDVTSPALIVPEKEPTRYSDDTLRKVMKFLERINVDVKKVKDGVIVDGQKLDENGVADLTNRMIQYLDGKSDALIEESMHFAVEILEQTNPKLFEQMLNKIGSDNIYKVTFNDYHTNPYYKTSDGKPDIRKIKKEAIAKKMATILVNKDEADAYTYNQKETFMIWWEKVVDWFRNLFAEAEFNPFEEATIEVMDRGAGTATTPTGKGYMFQLAMDENPQMADPNHIQTRTYNVIKESKANKLSSSEGYESLTGKKINNRVTDASEEYYNQIFKERNISEDDYRRAIYDIMKENGTAGHEDLHYLADNIFTDENGFLRKEPADDSDYKPKTTPAIYKVLKDYIQQVLTSYPEGTRFIFEQVVYDEAKDLAGTLDFIAITKEGNVAIEDWKFMALDLSKTSDVPWYKKNAFKLQVGTYRGILRDAYGIDASRLTKAQAVPILAMYDYEMEPDGTMFPYWTGVKVGNRNTKLETEDYLLPVAIEKQSSGDPTLDKYLEKLLGFKKNIERRSVTTAEERLVKADLLNTIERAYRHMQMKQSIEPLIDLGGAYIKQLNLLSDFYAANFKGKDFNTIDQKALNEFAIELSRAFYEIDFFQNLDQEMSFLFRGTLTDEQNKIYNDLVNVANNARRASFNIKELNNEFVIEVAKAKKIDGMLTPEVAVSMNPRWFTETSKLQTKAIQLMYELRSEAQHKIEMQTAVENSRLEDISKRFVVWAKSQGLSLKNYFDILVKPGTNKMIDEFQSDFYTKLKEALDKRDFAWIKNNVDLEKYQMDLANQKQTYLAYLDTKYYPGTPDEARRKKRKDIEKANNDYDLASPESLGWFNHYYTMRESPIKEKWQSEEWKKLTALGNEVAKELYDWIQAVNEKANRTGYLPSGTARFKKQFLPFAPNSLTSSLVFDGKSNIMESVFNNITIDNSATGLGRVNELTGEIENRIPTPYVTEIEDYSKNLFANLVYYNTAVNRFEYLSELEGTILAIGRLEESKESITTTLAGKPVYNRELDEFKTVKDNKKNASLYWRQVASLFYGQKYVDSEQFDIMLGSVQGTFNKINKFLGVEIMPKNMDKKMVSLVKIVENLTRWFTLTKLGFNPLSSISNTFGGTVQSIISSGKYFTKEDFIKSEYEMTHTGMQGEYGEKVMAAIKYFQPYTDDMTRDLAREVSLTTINENSVQDALMWMMRKGDRFVQSAVFLSFLRNQIVIEGKMMNVRDYLRQQPEWANRYQDQAKLRELEDTFDSRAQELLDKYGVLKLAKVENNELVIPGVDRQTEGVFRLRVETREFTKSVIGNMPPDQIMGIQQNLVGRSIMVFKNWIPPLIDVRYGKMKYNSATKSYEWGRARTLFRFLAVNGLSSLFRLSDAIKATPQGIEQLNALYEYKRQAYYEATGKQLEMTKEEFFDLTRQNLKNNTKDAIIALSLLAMYIAVKAYAPDDDDDEIVTNIHKFSLKALDKLTDELTFFYNPVAFQQILGGSIFPALGSVTDGIRLINHFGTEVYGMSFDEKLQEENHVIKYAFNVVPLGSMMASYMPLYAPELAKDLGIRMSTQSRLVR